MIIKIGGFMKLTILATLFLTIFLSSTSTFAGGIICKSCPGESEHCIPRPGCSRAASESIFETIMKIYDLKEGACSASNRSACKDKAVGLVCEISASGQEVCE